MLREWTKNYTRAQKKRLKELRVIYDEAMTVIMKTVDEPKGGDVVI
jgi:hypothetical protein